jgi:SAM-dependent methyltransferase
VLKSSADVLADMISLSAGDCVLDLGAGYGDVAQAVRNRHTDVSVMAVDGSPQMIRLMRDRFRSDTRVRIALCHLPSHDGDGIDLCKESYSCVVIHQCLGELIDSFMGLDALAIWCRQHLKQGGQLLVTAHNALVEVDPPNGFNNWNDPFRAALLARARKQGFHARRGNLRSLLRQEEVELTFARSGFIKTAGRSEEFDFDYEERRRLWHVPAVIGSLIDLNRHGNTDFERIVDHAVNSLQGQPSKPRTVVYWLFKLDDSRNAALPEISFNHE